ncbi:hypothetical protein CC1G_07901 [Coprinopsis cinerea okayama7|uniref:BTB domain-containing protein n=1 Tax=Coprinopsis cinerea (strain Okayama-7 / 130 / ATCC MYA-4618 / FGSC 9003) TaxID=240176 RepID=A8P6M3_COPC7|nr:hypothetical protein CC1G_07901 [Coprinopsis cinerea okayama7\|eukprot:XP_001839186.1 hypothetical protein CC1G_07901 [Coprinopsis cinerea okayama7\
MVENISHQPKHESYYWDSVVFSVDNVLFKVPKYHFVEGSEWFSTTYGLNDVARTLAMDAGSSSNGIITLPQVSSSDFCSFLEVLYPRTIQTTLTLCKAKWLSILKLSNQWRFAQIRTFAINQLSLCSLSAPERICLGKQYHVSPWFLGGCDELVRNEETISMETAQEIGTDCAVQLFICRERRLYAADPNYLQKVFAKELAAISDWEKEFSSPVSVVDRDGSKRQDEEHTRSSVEVERMLTQEDSRADDSGQWTDSTLHSDTDSQGDVSMSDAEAKADACLKPGQKLSPNDGSELAERYRQERDQLAAEAEELKAQEEAHHQERERLTEEIETLQAKVQDTLQQLVKEHLAHSQTISDHKLRLQRSEEAASKYRVERDKFAMRIADMKQQLEEMQKHRRYSEMGAFFQSISSGDRPRAGRRERVMSSVGVAGSSPLRMSWHGAPTGANSVASVPEVKFPSPVDAARVEKTRR